MILLIGFLAAAIAGEPQIGFQPEGPRSIALGVTTNAPFVARIVQERTRISLDGTRISEIKRGWLMQDSLGRQRREFDDGLAMILDPVGKVSLQLDSTARVALRSPLMDIAMDLKEGWSFSGMVPLAGPVVLRRSEVGQDCRVVTLRPDYGRSAEVCLSDDLHIPLEERVVAAGDEDYWRVDDLRRSEPDLVWFQTPEGYKETSPVGSVLKELQKSEVNWQ
jgi:hypothetical protein